MSDLGMDPVGEIQRRRASWQFNYLALGGHYVYVGFKYVLSDQIHEV